MPVEYLNTSISRAAGRTTVPQSCFDVRVCQEFLDRSQHSRVVPIPVWSASKSWSVDEHDSVAVQLKLVGHLDSVGPSPGAIPDFQRRSANAVYELQLQSLKSERVQADCRPYRGFPTPDISYDTGPKG